MFKNLDTVQYAVVDTETSGLTRSDVVVQCAIGLYDSEGNAVSTYNKLWKLPSSVTMNPRAQEVHMITPETLDAEGVPAYDELCIVLDLLQTLRAAGIPIVAHNKKFDTRMLCQTAVAHEIANWDIENGDMFCTMSAAKVHIGLRDKAGKLKAPSNAECYSFFFWS